MNLNGELAEAVTEVLSRYASGGVAVEVPAVDDEPPSTSTVGEVLVRAYIPIDGQEEQQKRRIEEGLWHLSQIQPLPQPEFRVLDEEDWQDSWKKHFQPLRIGNQLLITPTWINIEEGERKVIVLEPGMAFGTGLHPTTRLSLQGLENVLQPGDTLLDIGCGTGILSIAAVLLGADQVLAVDIDDDAVEASRENTIRNHVADKIRVEQGSLERVKILQAETRLPDIIVANIIFPVLTQLFQEGLETFVKPEGHIILSGVLAEQVDPLLERAEAAGLMLEEVLSEEDWRGLIFKKELPH
jgi:ribosomal protein L11 methyltransferase